MNKIFSHLINLFSVAFLLIFVLIFVTENTDLINRNYRAPIISALEKNTNLNIHIEKIGVKWDGLVPNILFNKIILSEKDTKKVIITGDRLVASLNLYSSILNKKIIPKEFNLVRTNIRLRYEDGKLLFKEKNVFDLKDYFVVENESKVDFSGLKFRITNSSIVLENLPSFKEYKLKKINFVLVSKNNKLKIFTTFNHINVNEFIHIAADLKLSKDEKPNGIIYSQGINLNIDKVPFELKNLDASIRKVNYILWSNINNGKISELDGKLRIDGVNLQNKLTKERFKITNLESNISYHAENYKGGLLLSKLNFNTENYKYKDNQFFLRFKEDKGVDLSFNNIEVDDLRSFTDLFPNMLNKKLSKKFQYVHSGKINKVKVIDFHKLKKTKFSLSFKNIDIIKKEDNFLISNLSGSAAGNYKRGFFDIRSPSVTATYHKFNDLKEILNIKTLIKYQFKKNNLYIYTKNMTVNNQHKLNMNASLYRGKLDFRITTSGDAESLNKTLQKYNMKFFSDEDLIFSGKYNIDVRGKNYNNKKNLYGVFEISDLTMYDKKNNISFTNLSTRINFNGLHAISEKTQFYFEKTPFDLLINTNVLNGKTKYFIQAYGKIDTDLVKNLLKIENEKFLQGTAFSKIRIYFTRKNFFEKINFNLISDLKGVSIDILGPLRKSTHESKLLNISYNYDKNRKNKTKVFFGKHKILVYITKNVWYLDVDSPYIKGKINWPLRNSEKQRVIANLLFLDMNKFSYPSNPNELPYLDLKSKQVKIRSLHLDNVDVLVVPTKTSLVFEKFIFKNIYLSMDAKGEWMQTNKKGKTFFEAKFKSSNLGKALKSLGYNGLIHKGKIDSQIIGFWPGSPETFKFSNFDGTLTLNSKNGEVLQVTKKTQAIGQLLGLFSISALPKRLSLDFSDFFSSGLQYDDMNGELLFKSGKVNTKKLILKGSFGEMRLTGETDLMRETYDHTLLFIPDLSSMSLITGTVLGGPIGAVAAIFYDKFLKEIGIDTNKLAAIEYSVTGPWENPEVKVTESFKPISN